MGAQYLLRFDQAINRVTLSGLDQAVLRHLYPVNKFTRWSTIARLVKGMHSVDTAKCHLPQGIVTPIATIGDDHRQLIEIGHAEIYDVTFVGPLTLQCVP